MEAVNCSGAPLQEESALFHIKTTITKKLVEHRRIQHLLEHGLLCVSIAATTLSFLLLSVLRIKKSERIFVHKNLFLSLGLANLLFVLDGTVFTTKMEHHVLCSTFAIFQHFFHTAVFTWMLVEGINLYIKLVIVYSARKQYLAYMGIGWGIPAGIVGLVAAIRPSTYDMREPMYRTFLCGSVRVTTEVERGSCWLNGDLWIFKGPILACLLANLVLFVVLMRVIFGKLAGRYGQDNVKMAKRGLWSIAALLPLLGVSWLLAFVIELHYVMKYIFILLTCPQGILFSIFHCFLDDEVQEALKKLCCTCQRYFSPRTAALPNLTQDILPITNTPTQSSAEPDRTREDSMATNCGVEHYDTKL